jgi:dTDP-4-amino-4,6-dideoxygalactose transaminase
MEHITNPEIITPVVKDWEGHVFHIFPVRCKQRDELQTYLTENGVQTVIHYPIPPHRQECYKGWNGLSFPITELIHEEELSLPMSPVMRKEEIVKIVNIINIFFNTILIVIT